MEEKAKVLEVKDLSVSYTVANVKTHILEDVSFAVSKGKSVGIVGESGCGKTTTMRAILNVLPSNGNVEKGEILYCGEDVLKMSNAKLQEYRQKGAGMIFQDPSSALNPVISIKNRFLRALKYARKDKKLTSKRTNLRKKQEIAGSRISCRPGRILNSYPFPVIRRGRGQRVLHVP
ncbi:MAG: ATP-binding cassette domain-containing protein [[Clostridium] scindens]